MLKIIYVREWYGNVTEFRTKENEIWKNQSTTVKTVHLELGTKEEVLLGTPLLEAILSERRGSLSVSPTPHNKCEWCYSHRRSWKRDIRNKRNSEINNETVSKLK